MMQFSTEKELFDMMEQKLYSGVVADILDELGYRNQAMRQDIRPLERDFVIAGRAKTILAVDVYKIPEDPYKMEIESIDSLKDGDVVVACTNRSSNNGYWGELLSTASMMRGARGAIIDGISRDTKKILELGFKVFTAGFKPLDSKGRGLVIDYDCPVACGDILVHPGDVIFADCDGIVVIPSDIAIEVATRALEKAERENMSRDELKQGAYLRDVYNKYGAL
jgi:4-hydroxy-4-methyl-2-oxoglutarate aldolase